MTAYISGNQRFFLEYLFDDLTGYCITFFVNLGSGSFYCCADLWIVLAKESFLHFFVSACPHVRNPALGYKAPRARTLSSAMHRCYQDSERILA